MSDPEYYGGFILVPRSIDEATFVTAVALVATNEEVLDNSEHLSKKYTRKIQYSRERVKEHLLLNTRYSVDCSIGGLDTLIFFDTLSTYHSLLIQNYYKQFEYLAEKQDEEAISRFLLTWTNVCEILQADYAYFTFQPLYGEDSYRDEVVLPALEQGRLSYLIHAAAGLYWLTYFHAHLVKQLGPLLESISGECELCYLPSGAVLVISHIFDPRNTSPKL